MAYKKKNKLESEKKAMATGPAPVPSFSQTARMTPQKTQAINAARQRSEALRPTPVVSKGVSSQVNSMYHIINLKKAMKFDEARFNAENPVYEGDSSFVPLAERDKRVSAPKGKRAPGADSSANRMSVKKEGEWKSMSKTACCKKCGCKKCKCCKKGLAGLMNLAKGF